jgi:ADP-heptose:LPS heptosyltransferase/lipopolysaccharide biosynthesis glycosyltransferase
MHKQPLAILTAIDKWGAPAANLALSINRHVSQRNVNIIILCQDMPDCDVKVLSSIPRVTTRNVAFPSGFEDYMLSTASPTSRIHDKRSLMPFCTFEAFSLLDEFRRVIWLDADTLVKSPIDYLLYGFSSFAATLDSPWPVQKNFLAPIAGYNMEREGICSAVLGLDDSLPYAEMHNWCYSQAQALAPTLFTRDQGIINLCVQHFDITPHILDCDVWQCMPWKSEAASASILHYGGDQKPWATSGGAKESPEWQAACEWWLDLGGTPPPQYKRTVWEAADAFLPQRHRKDILAHESTRVQGMLHAAKAAYEKEDSHLIKMKRRLNALKDAPSNGDSSEEWYLPPNRRAFALKQSLLHKAENNFSVLTSLRGDRPQVALVFGGGLGDALKPTSILRQLVETLHCDITLISDQKASEDLKALNPYITHVIFGPRNSYDYVDNLLQHANVFDLVLVYRYSLTYRVPKHSRIPSSLLHSLANESAKRRGPFDKYNFSNRVWPGMNNALSRAMQTQNMGVLQTLAYTSALPISREQAFSIPLYLPPVSDSSLAAFLSTPYITVHHGIDVKKLPQTNAPKDYGSTKNLKPAQWSKIVKYVRQQGIRVIQLGTANEDRIDGVDLCLNGLTNLDTTALILKHALCHLDTEGGLVHLNRSVNGRSVVMFGPTPVATFGYPQNINLAPAACKECFWTTQSWVLECPRKTSGPECMAAYVPEKVAATVTKLVGSIRAFSTELIAAQPEADLSAFLTRFDALDVCSLNPNKGLLVCSSAHWDFCIAATSDNGEAFEWAIADLKSDPVALANKRHKPRVGSFLNLNEESGSRPVIVCVSEEWSSFNGSFILSEMMRVLMDGGIIIGVCPEPAEAIKDIGSLYADFRLRPPDQSTTKAPLRIFALRKHVSDDGVVPINPTKELAYEPAAISCAPRLDSKLVRMHEQTDEALVKAEGFYTHETQAAQQSWEVSDHLIAATLKDGWINTSSDCVEGYGSHFLLDDWFSAETWGCWGEGASHSLLLPLPHDDTLDCILLEALIDLRLAPDLPERRIKIMVNGKVMAETTAVYGRHSDPSLMSATYICDQPFRATFIIVDICIDPPFIPSTRDAQSQDNRRLGLGLRRFRYKAVALKGTSAQTQPSSIVLKQYDQDRMFRSSFIKRWRG